MSYYAQYPFVTSSDNFQKLAPSAVTSHGGGVHSLNKFEIHFVKGSVNSFHLEQSAKAFTWSNTMQPKASEGTEILARAYKFFWSGFR